MTKTKRVRNRFAFRLPIVVVTAEFPDLAKQSMKDSSDINFIMARYARGGTVDHLAKHGADYGVFEPQTFHEAMNVVRKGEEMFADLPAEVRKRFHQSPVEFLAFIQDSGNLPEMRKLGLALPERLPDEIPRVRVVGEDGKPIVAPRGADTVSS